MQQCLVTSPGGSWTFGYAHVGVQEFTGDCCELAGDRGLRRRPKNVAGAS